MVAHNSHINLYTYCILYIMQYRPNLPNLNALKAVYSQHIYTDYCIVANEYPIKVSNTNSEKYCMRMQIL